MQLEVFTSAFCEPCIQARAVLAQVPALVPGASVVELDIVRDNGRAEKERIRSTPTVIVRTDGGAEVFRAEGVPTLPQVLVALAKAV